MVYGLRGKPLKPAVNEKGYLTVTLRVEGKNKKFSIHRLVAILFIPNPHNKPQVNHIDGVKTNNTIANLEWCTCKENKQHAMVVLGYGYGAKHSQAQITEAQVRRMCTMTEQGYRAVDIAKEVGIYIEKVRSIRKGQTWTHISKDYTFPKGLSNHGISDQTFLWICHMLGEGCTAPEIMKRYTGGAKIKPQMVSSIKRRKFRPHLSEPFTF